MAERRCPLSYELLTSEEQLYSIAGLRRLSSRLTHLEPLPYTQERLLQEAALRTDKISIGGVQPKISVRLEVGAGRFTVVDSGATHILKPINPLFSQIPENEDLTMRMAAIAGIPVPSHGLVFAQDGTLCYVIQRFDRVGRKGKLAAEDFGQLLGLHRDTKYNSSMEKIASVIEEYCTFPAVEFAALFRRVLVCFLTGNEDMHVKNFALLTTDDGVRILSPAYDFVNTTIVLGGVTEELALPLAGKRSNLRPEHLVNYYAKERLQLNNRVVEEILHDITVAQPSWDEVLSHSFLSDDNKEQFARLLTTRRRILGISSA